MEKGMPEVQATTYVGMDVSKDKLAVAIATGVTTSAKKIRRSKRAWALRWPGTNPEGSLVARDALLNAKAVGKPRRRMVLIRLEGGDRAPLLHHNEPILLDGRMIGSVTTGAFGHRVGASLALGMIRSENGVDAAFRAMPESW
jgi:hypothetical protein